MTSPLLLVNQSLQSLSSDGPFASRTQFVPLSASDDDRLSILDSSSSLRASLWLDIADAVSRGRLPGKLLRRAGEELVFALRLASSLMANNSTVCSTSLFPWISAISSLIWKLGLTNDGGASNEIDSINPTILRDVHAYDAYGEDIAYMDDEEIDFDGVLQSAELTNPSPQVSDSFSASFKNGRSGTSIHRLEDAIPVVNAALALTLTICDDARSMMINVGSLGLDDNTYTPCAVLKLAHASVRLLLSAVNTLPNGRKSLSLLLSSGGKGKEVTGSSTLSLLLSLRDRSILDTENCNSIKGKIHLGLVIDDIEKLITVSCFSRDVLNNFGPQSLLRANTVVQFAVLGISTTSASSKRVRPIDEKATTTSWKEAKPALLANEHILFDTLFFGTTQTNLKATVRAAPFIFTAYLRMRNTLANDDARLALVDSLVADSDNAATASLLVGKKRARSTGAIGSDNSPLDVMQSLHKHRDFAFATEILACLIGMNGYPVEDSNYYPFTSPNHSNMIDLCTRLRSISAVLTLVSESGAYSIHEDAAPYPQTSTLKLISRWIQASLSMISKSTSRIEKSQCLSYLRALGSSIAVLFELNHAVIQPYTKEIIVDVVRIGATIFDLSSSIASDVLDVVSAVLKSFVSVYSRLRQFVDLLDEYAALCATIGYESNENLKSQAFLHKVFLNHSHLRAVGIALRSLPPGQVTGVTSSIVIHTDKLITVASKYPIACFPSQSFLIFLSEALRQLQVTPASAQRSLAAAVHASYGPSVAGLRLCNSLSENANIDFLNLLSTGVMQLLMASWDVGIACAAQPSILLSVPSIYNCSSSQSISSLWPLNVLLPALSEEDSSRLTELVERASEPTLRTSDLAKALTKAYKPSPVDVNNGHKPPTLSLPVFTSACKWILKTTSESSHKGLSNESLRIQEGATEAVLLACASRLRLLNGLFTATSTSQDEDNVTAASFFADALLQSSSAISSTVVDLCVEYASKGKEEALQMVAHHIFSCSLTSETKESLTLLTKPWREDLLRSARLYEIKDAPLSLLKEAVALVRTAFWTEVGIKNLPDRKALFNGKMSPTHFSQAMDFLLTEKTKTRRPFISESCRICKSGIVAVPESKILERAIEMFLKLPNVCFAPLVNGSIEAEEVLGSALCVGILLPNLCRGFESFISRLLTSIPGIPFSILSLEKYSKGKYVDLSLDFVKCMNKILQKSEESYQDVLDLPYDANTSIISAVIVHKLKKVVTMKKDAKDALEPDEIGTAKLTSLFIAASDAILNAAIHSEGGDEIQRRKQKSILCGVALASTRLTASLKTKKGIKAIKALYTSCLSSNMFLSKEPHVLKKHTVEYLGSELECAAALEIHSGQTQVRKDGALISIFGLISKISNGKKLALSIQNVLDAAHGSPLYTELASRLLTEEVFTSNVLYSSGLADHCPVSVICDIRVSDLFSEDIFSNALTLTTSIIESASRYHDAQYFSCLVTSSSLPLGGFPGETVSSGSLAVRDTVVSLVRRMLPSLTISLPTLSHLGLKKAFELIRAIVSSPRLIPLSQPDVGLILNCLSSLQSLSLATRVASAVSSTIRPISQHRYRLAEGSGSIDNIESYLDQSIFERERILSSSTVLPIDRLVVDIGKFFGSSIDSLQNIKSNEAQIVTNGAMFVFSKLNVINLEKSTRPVITDANKISFPDASLVSSGSWILVGLLRHRKDASLASLPTLSQVLQSLFTLALTSSTDEINRITTGHDPSDGYPETIHLAPLVRCCELFSITVKVARYHAVNVLSRVFELLAKPAVGAALPAAGVPRVRDALVPGVFALFDALGPRQLQNLYQLFKSKPAEKALLKNIHRDYSQLTQVDLT